MAFPSIRSQANTDGTGATATPVVNLPATIRAGDTILVIHRCAVAGAIGWPDASWNELFDGSPDGSDDQFAAAWKKADGTEGPTITLSQTSGKFCSLSFSIRDAADPTLRAPELSTVATGTTPNEPDATTCTPTGGAKDYLWLTFFGMEGEQTGITAYPTNYTLGQSGLANSGTGGAVTTNVTAAGAARQANAASENAGVWDVTGTIDDWSAYTIAFHPAEVITENFPNSRRIFPATIPRNPALIGVGLTIAVNLLQSTLAPIIPKPYNQTDWPLPTRVKSQILVDINTRPVEDANIAFNNDWENPRIGSRNRVEWLVSGLKDSVPSPFISVEWKNPLIGKSNIVGFISVQKIEEIELPIGKSHYLLPLIGEKNKVGFVLNRRYDEIDLPVGEAIYENPLIGRKNNVSYIFNRQNEGVLSLPEGKSIYDSPLIGRRNSVSFIHTQKLEELDLPIGKNNQLNPIIGKRNDVNFVFNRKLDEATDPPFIPVDFKNPLIKGRNGVGFNYYVNYLDSLIPHNQKNWPNPEVKGLSGKTWIDTLLDSTLAPPVEALPPSNNNWPVYRDKSRLIVDISSVPIVEPPTEIVGIQLYPHNFKSSILALSWIQDRPFYYQDIKPILVNDWPNPLVKKKGTLTFVHSRKIDDVILDPFIPIIFNNPRIKERLRIDWQFMGPFQQIFTRPVGNYAFDLPLKGKTNLVSFINPTPSYYISSTVVPLNQVAWPNPIVKRRNGLAEIDFLRYEIDLGNPFEQTNWPNPINVKRSLGWIKTFTPDNNLPFIAQHLIIPRGKSKFTPIWLQFPPIITASGTPGIPYNYPNPIIIKKQVQGIIVNLLQTSLDPGIGAVPFNQKDYPNPLIGKRNSFEGWIQDKKFYFTEPSIQITQYDWPVYISVKKNLVGFIDFRLGASENKFNTLDSVPLREISNTLTHLDNPIIILTTTSGLIPFNQNNWIVPRRIKRFEIYSIDGVNYLVLPNIRGRVICLTASLTEFDLEAVLEDYDLTARADEFNLDTGGEECE